MAGNRKPNPRSKSPASHSGHESDKLSDINSDGVDFKSNTVSSSTSSTSSEKMIVAQNTNLIEQGSATGANVRETGKHKKWNSNDRDGTQTLHPKERGSPYGQELKKSDDETPILLPKGQRSRRQQGSCYYPEGAGKARMYNSDMYNSDAESASPILPQTNISLHTVSSQQRQTSPEKLTISHQQRQTSPEKLIRDDTVRCPNTDYKRTIFDICKTKKVGVVKLNKPLLETNRERRKERERSKDMPQHKYLRPGMILLKNFIGHNDQIRIVKICRDHGIGLGGFYQPGYRDGAKMHLQMMCFGRSWDPESRLYEDRRSFDGSVPPEIPKELNQLVYAAIKASHEHIKQTSRDVDVEDEIPLMSPDICIVNFYSNNGRLGLHQDRDESTESLRKGLPVVSFSIGDSADFLYGEERDVEKAKCVTLESGDVLVFGGKSRHIFHGVPAILPSSAPKRLIEDANLRPGRLNLTFRQY